MATKEQIRALQNAIFIAVIAGIGVFALQPGTDAIVGSTLIAAAVAFAILRTLHEHHRKGDARRAAMGFAKAMGVLGLLLLTVGTAVLVTGGTGLAAVDIVAGAAMLVYGTRRYFSLRG